MAGKGKMTIAFYAVPTIEITMTEGAVLASLAKAYVTENRADMTDAQLSTWEKLITTLNPEITC